MGLSGGVPAVVSTHDSFNPPVRPIDSTRVMHAFTTNTEAWVQVLDVSGASPAGGTEETFVGHQLGGLDGSPTFWSSADIAILDANTAVVISGRVGINGNVVGYSGLGITSIGSWQQNIHDVAVAPNDAAVACVTLDATHVFIIFAGSGHHWGQVVTISGTTLTGGTAVALDASGSSGSTLTYGCERIDSTHVLVLYPSAAGVGPQVQVCSIAGTTVTVGTPVILGSSSPDTHSPGLAILTPTLAVATYTDGGLYTACPVAISGMTVTAGTEATIDSDASSFTGSQALAALDASHAAACYISANDLHIRAAALDVTSAAVTVETPIVVASVGAADYMRACGFAGHKGLIAWADDNESPEVTHAAILSLGLAGPLWLLNTVGWDGDTAPLWYVGRHRT